jgi:Zn-dependent M28 family amino/carboxypeptidase
LISIGLGQTTLDADLEELAHRRGRVVRADSEPEKGYYYRSDHFEFARVGVPALYACSGQELIGRPAGTGKRLWAEFTRERYHKPGDELRDDWDLGGAVDDLQLLYELGLRIAAAPSWPAWKPGSEFRARRLAQVPEATANR